MESLKYDIEYYLCIVFVPVVICLFCSCAGTTIKSLSDIKWSGKDINIRNHINNDGYFFDQKRGLKYIFYDDGTFVCACRACLDTLAEGEDGDLAVSSFENNEWDRTGTGIYRLSNDTIFVNNYYVEGFYFPLNTSLLLLRSSLLHIKLYTLMIKQKFKIIDRQTILLFETHWSDGLRYNRSDTLRFVKHDNLPPSNTTLKKKKWLWNDKSEWKTYMNRRKKWRKDIIRQNRIDKQKQKQL
jgi:hypothetical protein